MKALVGAFNQEKALVGAFSVITYLRMDIFEALVYTAALQHLTMTSTTVMMSRTRPRQPSTTSTTVNLCREEPDTSLSSPAATCTCHVSHWATCDTCVTWMVIPRVAGV